jgi:hypothetical protein
MNRNDLHRLSATRAREARVLLDNSCYDGAYYLIRYAVECALKACIAKETRRYDFPDKRTVVESYVHDLDRLVKTETSGRFGPGVEAGPKVWRKLGHSQGLERREPGTGDGRRPAPRLCMRQSLTWSTEY